MAHKHIERLKLRLERMEARDQFVAKALAYKADASAENEAAMHKAYATLESLEGVDVAIYKVLAATDQPGYKNITGEVAKALSLREEVVKGLSDHGVDTGASINFGDLADRPVPKLNMTYPEDAS
jgi:hypothetical protein